MTSHPRAFRLPDPASPGPSPPSSVLVTDEPPDAIEAADGTPVLPRRRMPWVGILVSALGGLATLAIGTAVERLVADLFAAAPALGWAALGLAGLALIAFAAIVARELAGAFRERRIERLRTDAADAIATRDGDGAKRVARAIADLYAGRAVAGNGPGIRDVEDEILDADDRLAVAERTLLVPLDADAKRAIATAAKRVSVVTAVSPRAIVDVLFVIYAGASLLGQVARIYGGRPGLLGALRLGRAAINHLAVTGGVAVGDGLIQGALGAGLAARVSARLGEGVLNGLMTARFGLAALEVCRPLPFVREAPPRLSDVAGELLSRADGPA